MLIFPRHLPVEGDIIHILEESTGLEEDGVYHVLVEDGVLGKSAAVVVAVPGRRGLGNCKHVAYLVELLGVIVWIVC